MDKCQYLPRQHLADIFYQYHSRAAIWWPPKQPIILFHHQVYLATLKCISVAKYPQFLNFFNFGDNDDNDEQKQLVGLQQGDRPLAKKRYSPPPRSHLGTL